jgi:hypothetical protein
MFQILEYEESLKILVCHFSLKTGRSNGSSAVRTDCVREGPVSPRLLKVFSFSKPTYDDVGPIVIGEMSRYYDGFLCLFRLF